MERAASYESHTGYMHTRQLTAAILDAAIQGFEAQKRRIDEQIAQVRQLQNGHQPVAVTTSEPQKQPGRKMSAATRKRMGEAQSKRWAVAKSGAGTISKATAMPKRKLSAAGRAAIVAALKKRWAAKRASLTVVRKTAAKKATPRKAVAKKAA